jgi:hypothetical protein
VLLQVYRGAKAVRVVRWWRKKKPWDHYRKYQSPISCLDGITGALMAPQISCKAGDCAGGPSDIHLWFNSDVLLALHISDLGPVLQASGKARDQPAD